MRKVFYLLVDYGFSSCYAVNIWINKFGQNENFKGVLLKGAEPSDSLKKRRNEFHIQHAGKKIISSAILAELKELYPRFDEIEEAMIRLFGIPNYPIDHFHKTVYLGNDINGDFAYDWVRENIGNTQPHIFSHLGQIVKPWWIDIARGQLFNVHSAVLPYARGVHTIENIAASQDLAFFKKSVGISIHLIDEGVDTGPIISVYKIRRPFHFNSIWELKGYIYKTGYHLYADMALKFIFENQILPVPIISNPELKGPNFKYKSFTTEQKRRAEKGYLAMKVLETSGLTLSN